MSLTATSRSIGGSLRQEVVVDGRHRFLTDEPEAVGGNGSAPAPHELLPAALASCISTTLVMYARAKGWELGGVRVEVDYDHRASPRRFDVSIALGVPQSAERLARLEKVAATCPVGRALASGAEVAERIAAPTLAHVA